MKNVNIGNSIISLVFLLLSICCIAGCGNAQEKEPQAIIAYCDIEYENDMARTVEKAKWESTLRGEFYYSEDDLLTHVNLYKKYTSILRYKLEYDNHGNITKYTAYSGDIAKNIREYEYDATNRLTKCSVYNINTLTHYWLYEYDANGYLIKRSTYTNDIQNDYIAYEYNTDGKVLSEITYGISEDGTSYNEAAKSIFEYDTQNRIVSETRYWNNQIMSKDEYDYSGENTKITSYNTNNSERKLELSNIIERNDHQHLVFQDSVVGRILTNTFDEKGNLISSEHRFNNSVVYWHNEYDEKENLTKISCLIDEKNGYSVKYYYDDNDVVTLSEVINDNNEIIITKDTLIDFNYTYKTNSRNIMDMEYTIEYSNKLGGSSYFRYHTENGSLAYHTESYMDSEGNTMISLEERYNEDGKLTYKEEINQDGSEIIQEYDDEGKLRQLTEKFPDGNTEDHIYTYFESYTRTIVVERDRNTGKSKEAIYFGENKLAFYLTYTGNNRNKTDIKVYNSNNKIIYETSQGEMLNESGYYPNKESYSLYFFDNITNKKMCVSYKEGDIVVYDASNE